MGWNLLGWASSLSRWGSASWFVVIWKHFQRWKEPAPGSTVAKATCAPTVSNKCTKSTIVTIETAGRNWGGKSLWLGSWWHFKWFVLLFEMLISATIVFRVICLAVSPFPGYVSMDGRDVAGSFPTPWGPIFPKSNRQGILVMFIVLLKHLMSFQLSAVVPGFFFGPRITFTSKHILTEWRRNKYKERIEKNAQLIITLNVCVVINGNLVYVFLFNKLAGLIMCFIASCVLRRHTVARCRKNVSVSLFLCHLWVYCLFRTDLHILQLTVLPVVFW